MSRACFWEFEREVELVGYSLGSLGRPIALVMESWPFWVSIAVCGTGEQKKQRSDRCMCVRVPLTSACFPDEAIAAPSEVQHPRRRIECRNIPRK